MDTNQSSTWQNKMLGRYRLTQLLGRGGMGEVWLAEDTQLRRQVAVKLLPSVFATDRDFLQDFEREAQAAAALEHPHILPIHDFGEQIAEDEVATYLITPYISGGTLRDRILSVSGPLPTDEAGIRKRFRLQSGILLVAIWRQGEKIPM
jgi:serine/threonine protein kinase